jgi:hypothetical protein
VKLFSKEFDQLDADKKILNFLENGITNLPQLFFALFAFEGIVTNFFKRRESSNKKYVQLTKEITEKPDKERKEKEKDDILIIEKEQIKYEEEERVVTEEDLPQISKYDSTPLTIIEEKVIEPEPVPQKEPKVKKQPQPKTVSKDSRKTRPKKANVSKKLN